jgi:hypothetical protein
VTALAQAAQVAQRKPQMRVSGELKYMVDVNSGRYPISSDAMLAQILVTLQRLGSYPSPLSVIASATGGATVAVSLPTQLGVIVAVSGVGYELWTTGFTARLERLRGHRLLSKMRNYPFYTGGLAGHGIRGVGALMHTSITVFDNKTRHEEELFFGQPTSHLPVLGDWIVCFGRRGKVTERTLNYDKKGRLSVFLDVDLETTSEERMASWKP